MNNLNKDIDTIFVFLKGTVGIGVRKNKLPAEFDAGSKKRSVVSQQTSNNSHNSQHSTENALQTHNVNSDKILFVPTISEPQTSNENIEEISNGLQGMTCLRIYGLLV